VRRVIGTAAAALLLLRPLCCDVARADAAAPATEIGARRHLHRHALRAVVEPPRYYARPVHYRPYPYRVPAPFVFGFGPFW
jgi:hypothetical protein